MKNLEKYLPEIKQVRELREELERVRLEKNEEIARLESALWKEKHDNIQRAHDWLQNAIIPEIKDDCRKKLAKAWAEGRASCDKVMTNPYEEK